MIHLTVQQLSASLDGALTGPSLELVVRHLAACHDCRDRQARLAKHDDALRRLMGQEPSDIFLDDLTRRAEALATAIARGIPAPIMVTSVPLLHEEDPFAPVEPPPLPPRPELGKSGQLAKEAGWGRIGVKPTVSTQAPQSDPEEAQRMLEALASGNTDDFTELTPQGLEEHTQVDGPVFELPAWIKDQSGSGPRVQGPREVRKLDVFFEDLDEHAAGMTREAVNEVFRHEDAPAPAEDEALAPESYEDEPPASQPLPPGHAAYAPPGWTGDPAAHEYVAPAQPEAVEYVAPGHDEGYTSAEPAAYAPAGWHFEPAPPDDPSLHAWDPAATQPGTFDSGAYPQPHAGPFGDPPADPYRVHSPGTGRTPEVDRVAVLALAAVGALLLILLALQLLPAGQRSQARTGSRAMTGGKFPQVRILPHHEQEPAPAPPKAHVRTAETQAPVEQVVPPTALPVPTEATEHNPPAPATDAIVTPPPVQHPGAAGTTASTTGSTKESTTHAPARVAHPAAAPAPAPAHDPTPAPPAASDDSEWPLLCGQVTDEAGAPVINARVSMAEISFATRTDSRGRFCVSAPAGKHSLDVEGSGFTPERVPVTIASSTMDVHLVLHPAH